MDNIGASTAPRRCRTAATSSRATATSWMGMFCLNLLRIALELATHRRAYEDIATKFFEHFLQIAAAMSDMGGTGIRSGIRPTTSSTTSCARRTAQGRAAEDPLDGRPGAAVRGDDDRADELERSCPSSNSASSGSSRTGPTWPISVSRWTDPGAGERRLLAILRGHRMEVRAEAHARRDRVPVPVRHPLDVAVAPRPSVRPRVRRRALRRSTYQPAESTSGLFGGNSNWRGPIWFPVNYLLIESLQQFHWYHSDDFKVEVRPGPEVPGPSPRWPTRSRAALIRIFTRGTDGRRPVLGNSELLQNDPHFRDYVPMFEYFHGDDGSGLGASHQTGWTALVAKLIRQQGMFAAQRKRSNPPARASVGPCATLPGPGSSAS